MHDINIPVTAQNGLAAIIQGELSSTSPTSALVYYTNYYLFNIQDFRYLKEKKEKSLEDTTLRFRPDRLSPARPDFPSYRIKRCLQTVKMKPIVSAMNAWSWYATLNSSHGL